MHGQQQKEMPQAIRRLAIRPMTQVDNCVTTALRGTHWHWWQQWHEMPQYRRPPTSLIHGLGLGSLQTKVTPCKVSSGRSTVRGVPGPLQNFPRKDFARSRGKQEEHRRIFRHEYIICPAGKDSGKRRGLRKQQVCY